MEKTLSRDMFLKQECIFCEACHHKILFSDEQFIIALDNFPLVEGHILIFSRAHYGCAGEFPIELLVHLEVLKNKVAVLLGKTYGTVVFYEHGRAGSCVNFGPDERLCHHFHLHALPLAFDISDELHKMFLQRINVSSYATMRNLFVKFGEYLYFENNEKMAWFYPVSDKIPSHLMRTLIANGLKLPELANWENFKGTVDLGSVQEKLRSDQW